MARLLLALIGVILLAVVALALLWLLGQVMVGVGAFVVGTAGVLSRLLWFLIFTGLLSGLVYFVTSAWRQPSRAAVGGPVRLDTASTAFAAPAAPAPTRPAAPVENAEPPSSTATRPEDA